MARVVSAAPCSWAGLALANGKEAAARRDAGGHELARGIGAVPRRERLDHLAAGADPLADLEDALAREQHARGGGEQVEHVLAAPLPPDLVDVAEAARRQQSH